MSEPHDDSKWMIAGHVPERCIPRARRKGELAWTLKGPSGDVMTCQVFDDTAKGAGFDVVIGLDGEPQWSRRCADRMLANYVAQKLGQDQRTFGGYKPVEPAFP
jgi:hypothetical protein